MRNLESAWEKGEIRPTHQAKAKLKRWWRTRSGPFEDSWPLIDGWLLIQPELTDREVMIRLNQEIPDKYSDLSLLRTLQRRLQNYRQHRIKKILLNAETEKTSN